MTHFSNGRNKFRKIQKSVVYNAKLGKVLRITKAPSGAQVNLDNERAEIEKRLAYENDVIVRSKVEVLKKKFYCLGADFEQSQCQNAEPGSNGIFKCRIRCKIN